MEATAVANGKHTGFKLAHLAAKAVEGKEFAEDLMEVGKRKAQRLVRRSYAAGEDYLDDTTHFIKHHPWQSIGVALGVGLTLGFFGGFFSTRKRS